MLIASSGRVRSDDVHEGNACLLCCQSHLCFTRSSNNTLFYASQWSISMLIYIRMKSPSILSHIVKLVWPWHLLLPLSLCLSLSLSVCLSLSLSVCLSVVYRSLCLNLCPCIIKYCLILYVFLALSVSFTLCRSLCLLVCLSVVLILCERLPTASVCLFVCLSVYLSVCLSVCLSISLST